MNVACMADLHGRLPVVPNGTDLLLIAGDLVADGHNYDEYVKLCEHLESKCKHIVVTAGNHDWEIYYNQQVYRDLFAAFNLTLLIDDHVTILGKKIYGTPWTHTFGMWAYMLPQGSTELAEKYIVIPTDTDILLTHAPPYGILDDGLGEWPLVGVVKHTDTINLHVFGHIHGEGGKIATGFGTTFVNACLVNEMHALKHEAVVVEVL